MTQDEKVALLRQAGVWDVIGFPGCIDKLIDIVAANVRTKDLTDDEIAEAVGSPLDEVYLADFRAVIAADRSKNK